MLNAKPTAPQVALHLYFGVSPSAARANTFRFAVDGETFEGGFAAHAASHWCGNHKWPVGQASCYWS